MKNPNGYGTVVKLSGKRRRPYAVRITTGYNEKGHPIQKAIGYTETKKEGMILLAEYNRNPYDIETSKITLRELFDKWLVLKAKKLSDSHVKNLKTAMNIHCIAFENTPYKEIKAYQMQYTIDNCKRSYSVQKSIKTFWKQMDDTALEIGVTSAGYSKLLTADSTPDTSKTEIPLHIINELWDRKDDENVKIALFLLYTGFRSGELSELKKESVKEIDGILCIQGGKKTKAGKDRIVPVHSKIEWIVRERLTMKSEWLFTTKRGCHITPPASSKIFKEVFGGTYKAHECRHTLCSELDRVGANEVCVDRIIGHTSDTVRKRVYTHKTIEELKATIELVTY